MIVLDYQDRRPLYEQIVKKLEALILCGALAADAQMPSVRKLSMELSINPNTVQRAYAELERQGFIYPVKGRGNFVSPSLDAAKEKRRRYLQDLDSLLAEGKQLGFSREELEAEVRRIYAQDSVASQNTDGAIHAAALDTETAHNEATHTEAACSEAAHSEATHSEAAFAEAAESIDTSHPEKGGLS